MALREKDPKFDIESGGNISKEDDFVESNTIKGETKNIWSRLTEDTSLTDEVSVASNGNSANSLGRVIADEKIELLIDKNLEGGDGHEFVAIVEKNNTREKHKNKKKAMKPPRPPKGPLLDAADRMLVKEIAVLAMKKRARSERIKALKKAKAEKTSSLNSCIPALIITFLFFFVIIIQGMSSRNSSLLQGSPEPAVAGSGGLISVQYIKSFPPNENNAPSPSSVNFAS